MIIKLNNQKILSSNYIEITKSVTDRIKIPKTTRKDKIILFKKIKT